MVPANAAVVMSKEERAAVRIQAAARGASSLGGASSFSGMGCATFGVVVLIGSAALEPTTFLTGLIEGCAAVAPRAH